MLDIHEDESDELNESNDERPECCSPEVISEQPPEGGEDGVDADTSFVSVRRECNKDQF